MTSSDPLVAIVDDEASVRTMLGRLLRLANYEVAPFKSGEEFLASLTARIPACVILDLHMPGLSGLEVQSRLHASHIDLPAVFITASYDVALDQAVAKAGGVKLLRKPFSNERLLEAIDAALLRKQCDPSGK